ncbi:transcription antitermination factor NusB [Tetragenococcus halophilus]|uniref:transcription antitermination factor NusB n=1 Tax=Tetragenococcus halophilus TaxID=51669 RepID=UPI000CB600D0|nr:transcription antitermination factor NusB [Tetragenococcus halophilus]NRR74982.1 transcription antitermination factor NusB [Tetragenococcus halophilus]NWN99012.1 transcription antitermination factor NusB [Tetragenococcus halophilus]RQD29300.1 transcription antitermination factor NusB [Tetragenococcus halophilus subsp. halophilus DSM 20339]WJS81442.1 transcription antitermination factor NusB [Tetragenococcus halophilus]GBD58847.1 transcription antitermination protein NusB [Tetragenococcus ha
MSKELSRHEIRKKAVQALFPLDINQSLAKKDAIDAALELENSEIVDKAQENFVPPYLDLLVTGVCEKKAELDERIKNHLRKGWRLERLSKMDLVVLRIALFEMLYVDDTPNRVALNEAIELAKTFSDENSHKFVNGILSAVNTEIEASL